MDPSESPTSVEADYSLLNCVAESIIVVDIAGNLLFTNRAATDMWPSLQTTDHLWQWPLTTDGERNLRAALTACAEHGRADLHDLHQGTSIVDCKLCGHRDAIVITMHSQSQSDYQQRERERHYRTIADNAYDWEYWIDAGDNLIYMSPSCELITGYTREDFFKTPDLLNDIVLPEDRNEWLQHRRHEKGHSHTDVLTYRICHRDSGVRWIEHACREVIDADGHFDGYRASNRDVTDRMIIEQARRESDTRYHQIFENTAITKLVVDPTDGRIVEANSAAAEFYGYSIDQLQSMRIPDVNPLPPDQLARNMQQALAENRTFIFQNVLASGEIRDVQVFPSAITQGEKKLLYVIIHDITAQKQAERALREGEATLRAIFESVDYSLILVDTDYRVMLANGIARASTGSAFGVEMPPNADIRDFVIPGEQASFEANFQTALGGSSVVYENRHQSVHSGEMWFEFRFDPTKTAAGEVVGVCLTARNITGRKQAELRLLEAEERFRQLAENINEVFWLSEQKPYKLLYLSPAFERIWGQPVDRQYQDQNAYFERVHPADIDRVRAYSARIRDGIDIYAEVDFRIMPPDGEMRTIRSRVFPIFDKAGRVYRHAGVMTDITDQVQAQQQALELALQRERVAILADFVRSASHEFRTPLTLIGTAAHLIRRYDDPVKQLAKLDQIDEQVVRMTRLVDGLLLLTRLDTEIKPAWAAVNLDGALRQALNVYEDRIAALRLHVDYTPPSPALFIRADNELIGHALLCLLDNAIRYSPEGSSLHITTSADDDLLSITIRDEGPGIAAENLPYVFDRFYRGDKAHSTAGLGLGLSIAEQAVKLMDGRIEVESEPGAGSTFTIMLPHR